VLLENLLPISLPFGKYTLYIINAKIYDRHSRAEKSRSTQSRYESPVLFLLTSRLKYGGRLTL